MLSQNKKEISFLIKNISNEVFFKDFFETKPLFGKSAIKFKINFSDVFDIVHEAYLKNDVRFSLKNNLNVKTSTEIIAARLKRERIRSHKLWFKNLFEKEGVSITVFNASKYIPTIGNARRALDSLIDGYLSDFCIATPPNAATTNIHYDTLDIFNFHVLGEKKWNIYTPITHLPNKHVHRPHIDNQTDSLKHYSEYALTEGSFLYMPRGWIHTVENQSKSPSLQFAISITADSWISLFSNIMNYAYGRLSLDEISRKLVQLETFESPFGITQLNKMKKEFDRFFFEAVTNGLSANLSFIHHPSENIKAIKKARAATKKTGSSKENMKLVRTQARFLIRECNSLNHIAISSNGDDFISIPLTFWEYLKSREEHTIDSLLKRSGLTQIELIEHIDAITNKLGIYGFEKY